MKLALVALAFFSITAGFVGWPEALLRFNPFGNFIGTVFGSAHAAETRASGTAEGMLLGASAFATVLGIYLALVYFRHGRYAHVVDRSPLLKAVHRFFFLGWGFDWLYDRLFVRSYKAIAAWNRGDAVNVPFVGLAELARLGNAAASSSQTGRMRNYAFGIVLGAVALVSLVLLR